MGLNAEFKALEPYRDRTVEAQTLPFFDPPPALLLCGRFGNASFVLSQQSDGAVEISLRGPYGRREKRALTRMLGIDLTKPSEYVRVGGDGELWVFPGRRRN
jgi:hypothetical protein